MVCRQYMSAFSAGLWCISMMGLQWKITTALFTAKTQWLEFLISMALRSLTITGEISWDSQAYIGSQQDLRHYLLIFPFIVLNNSALTTAMRSCNSSSFNLFWSKNRKNISERGFLGSMWVDLHGLLRSAQWLPHPQIKI